MLTGLCGGELRLHPVLRRPLVAAWKGSVQLWNQCLFPLPAKKRTPISWAIRESSANFFSTIWQQQSDYSTDWLVDFDIADVAHWKEFIKITLHQLTVNSTCSCRPIWNASGVDVSYFIDFFTVKSFQATVFANLDSYVRLFCNANVNYSVAFYVILWINQ